MVRQKKSKKKNKKVMLLRSNSGKDVQPFIRISNSWNDNLNAPRPITNDRSKAVESFLEKLDTVDNRVLRKNNSEQGPIEIVPPDLNEPEKIMLATEYLNVLRPIAKRPAAGIS